MMLFLDTILEHKHAQMDYITYYLKAAALLLYILERCKVNSRPAEGIDYLSLLELMND